MLACDDGAEAWCICDGRPAAQAALWAAHSALFSLDPTAAVMVLRDDEQQTETIAEDDPFIAEELALAALLASLFASRLEIAEPILREAFRSPYDARRIADGIGEASRIFSGTMTAAGEAEVATILGRTITNGAIDGMNAPAEGRAIPPASSRPPPAPPPAPPGDASVRITILNPDGSPAAPPAPPPIIPPGGGTPIEGMPSVQQLHEGMIRAARYTTNNFFNRQIMPALFDRIDTLLEGTDPTAVPDLTAIRELLDRRLRSVPYWRMVANASASRAYHYGFLRVAMARGALRYKLRAVLDERTSAICRHMNGKTFSIASAVATMERAAAAETVEEMKQETPWLRVEEARRLTNDELRARGFLVPPFHGHCRTTVVWL